MARSANNRMNARWIKFDGGKKAAEKWFALKRSTYKPGDLKQRLCDANNKRNDKRFRLWHEKRKSGFERSSLAGGSGTPMKKERSAWQGEKWLQPYCLAGGSGTPMIKDLGCGTTRGKVAATVVTWRRLCDANEKTNDNEYWGYGKRRWKVALNV